MSFYTWAFVLTLPFSKERAGRILSSLEGPEPSSDIARTSQMYTHLTLSAMEMLFLAGGEAALSGFKLRMPRLGRYAATAEAAPGRSVGAAHVDDPMSGMNYGEAQAIFKSVRRHTERLVFGKVESNDSTVRDLTTKVQKLAAEGDRRAAGGAMHDLNTEFLKPLESPNLRIERRLLTPGGQSKYRHPDYMLIDPSYPGGRPYGIWDLKINKVNELSYTLSPQFRDIRGATGLGLKSPVPLGYRLPRAAF
jgi:hypothetical protein